MKGRLQDRSLGTLLDDLQNRSSSGVLTLERGPTKKQICFVKGHVRFAASNIREDRLGEFLIAAGAVSEDVIRRAEGEIAQGHKLGELLISWSAMTPEDLRDYMRAHVLNIVVPCFPWRDGHYRFQEGVPNIVGEVTADVPVLEFLLENGRRSVSDAQIKKVLHDREMTPVLSAARGRDLSGVKLTQAETFLVAQAESGASLGHILGLSRGAEAELARAAAVLATTGVFSLVPASSGDASGIFATKPPALKGGARGASEPTAVVAAEILYYRQMHALLRGVDAYKTLSVERDATTDQVRRAYYVLAKEIHPDRFLSPPLDVLHQEMEDLFSQVLEAYNTLIDPNARERYNAEHQAAPPTPKAAASDQHVLARQNFIRGRMLFEEGKMVEALGFLQNAADGDPNRAEYFRLLGNVQARNPRMRAEAESSFLRAIELDPARGDAYLQLGLLYRRLGETQKAIGRLQECLKWDPANVEAGAALAEMGAPAHGA